jgi:lipopolysaccharide transport system ATP-binding protein
MIGKLKTEDLRVVSPAPEGTELVPLNPRTVGIEVRGATLQYPLGPFVRGSIKSSLFSLFGHRDATPKAEYVNAITNLNLSISRGERIGLIGSNGSGKSTLLRALAGVYPLKAGEISVLGQIGTLLDLSLGFEAESTGRENIYYRGMAMGFSRGEIAKAEAEIVDFAGLGDFIDLPMRTYSSGMSIRLGFAVSTQFHPDVLLIDEVFGAGDAAFAQKALKRMSQIVASAGIVVLASHDLALIQNVCNRVLWIYRGEVVRDGPAAAVLPQFQEFMHEGRLPSR